MTIASSSSEDWNAPELVRTAQLFTKTKNPSVALVLVFAAFLLWTRLRF
jgi:hypothetical protein